MSADLTIPLDTEHERCVAALAWVRDQIDRAKAWVAEWEPRPLPPKAARR